MNQTLLNETIEQLGGFECGYAIVKVEGKGYNCIDKNGCTILEKFYDQITVVEKKVGVSREGWILQEFLLTYDADANSYGLYDRYLREILPTQFEYIEVEFQGLSLDARPTQTIIAKSHEERWIHLDLITGCSFDSSIPCHGIKAIYDKFHSFYGFESNNYYIKKCPFWLEYECCSADGLVSYDEDGFWDDEKQIYYIINHHTKEAVSFASNEDDLWRTLRYGEWDSRNRCVLNPQSYIIPEDWLGESKEIRLCKGFKLRTYEYDGWWGMVLVEERL